MNNIFTLKEFVDELFVDKDQIKGIYIDNENNEILNKLSGLAKPLDVLRSYKNIMTDDEYLELVNGEYVFDPEKIYSQYSNYVVSLYYPIIKPENVAIVNNLVDKLSEYEYAKNVSQYSDGCEILIRPPLLTSFDKEFFPDTETDIDGWIMMDYKIIDARADDPDGIDFVLTPIGFILDKSKITNFIAKRKELYTASFCIQKGMVVMEKSQIYFTNPDGTIEYLADFETHQCINEDEDGTEN